MIIRKYHANFNEPAPRPIQIVASSTKVIRIFIPERIVRLKQARYFIGHVKILNTISNFP
jgi:hypothetical protein